jgi:hypothetical protein
MSLLKFPTEKDPKAMDVSPWYGVFVISAFVAVNLFDRKGVIPW